MYINFSNLFTSKASIKKEIESKEATLDINSMLISYIHGCEVTRANIASNVEKLMLKHKIDILEYLGVVCTVKNNKLIIS